jgi:hypothetical protein
MKKSLLFFLCTCISLSFSFGQTSKGTKFWLVDFGINGNKGEKTTSSNAPNIMQNNSTISDNGFSLSMGIGRFFRNNVAHGLKANYYNNSGNSTNTSIGTSYKEFNAKREGVKLGYFISRFIPVSSQFYFYGELNPNIYYSRYSFWYDNLEENKQNECSISLQASVGMRYVFKNNLFVDMNTSIGSMGYNWTNNEDNYKYSSFSLYSNPNLSNFNIGIGKSF